MVSILAVPVLVGTTLYQIVFERPVTKGICVLCAHCGVGSFVSVVAPELSLVSVNEVEVMLIAAAKLSCADGGHTGNRRWPPNHGEGQGICSIRAVLDTHLNNSSTAEVTGSKGRRELRCAYERRRFRSASPHHNRRSCKPCSIHRQRRSRPWRIASKR